MAPSCARFVRPHCETLEPREVPATAWALTTGNALLKFDTADPGTILATLPLTGMQPGDRVAEISFDTTDGRLYALGVATNGTTDTGRLYTVNLRTGALASISTVPGNPLPAGNRYGMDVSPLARGLSTFDTVRIVSDAGVNLRTFTGGGSPSGPSGDTPLTPPGSQVIAAGYSNNIANAPRTTLYGIAAATSQLIIQGGPDGNPSPDAGVLTNVGPLGLTLQAGSDGGFDVAPDGRAFAALTDAATGRAGLYTVDLRSGTATAAGPIGDGRTPVAGLTVAPTVLFAVGAGRGGAPQVNVYNGDGSPRMSFLAYDAGFRGGVRVATGDVNRDGVPDVITGTGPGGSPHVKAFSGKDGAQLFSFYAFDPSYTRGVYVAAGDRNGDGYADMIVGTGGGTEPTVAGFSGFDGASLGAFQVFGASSRSRQFRGEVRVAARDLDGDAKADLVVGQGPGGQALVEVYYTLLLVKSPPQFPAPVSVPGGGIYVAMGDLTGTGTASIVTSADSGRAAVAGPDKQTFPVLGGAFGGATVALADVNGDGFADYLVGNGRLGSRVQVLDGQSRSVLLDLEPFGSFRGGAFVG